MATIVVCGRLGRDPEELKNGGRKFSLAEDVYVDGEKKTQWWSCVQWDFRKELNKGSSVQITGDLIEREYTDKEGVQKKALQINVMGVKYVGGKKKDEFDAF